MEKILIDAIYPQETRVIKLDKDNKILNLDYESAIKKHLKGNVYLAKVTRVEPSLQAAFIEYGESKQGFLPFIEIHPDYYQIPADDKKKLEQEFFSHKEKQEVKNSRLDKIVNNNEEDTEEEKNIHLEKNKIALAKKYKIQEVVKKNQLILVQVVKEERGNKGVSLSTYLSLAGRYCVLMPNSGSKSGGISRRIDNIKDRKRLRELIKSFNIPHNTSIILRTIAAEHNDKEIEKDYNYLAGLWNNIRQNTLNAVAPALIHQEADVLKRAVRDLYNDNISDIIVDGHHTISKVKSLINVINPSAIKKVKEHRHKKPIFTYYKIEQEVEKFYGTNAQLPSGGYLVINITEALISIDVNSGRSTQGRSVEETALKTNLEAASEVARQLILRDLSGLIVVDFIDMMEVENRKTLEKELKKSFAEDKARVQISRVSYFGLVEMSRQRLKPSLIETNMISCPNCSGTGYVKSYDVLAIDIFRDIRNEVLKSNVKAIKTYVSSQCMSYIMNFKRNNILALEQENKIKLFIYIDSNLGDSQYKLETFKSIPSFEKDSLDHDKIYDISKTRIKHANNNLEKGIIKKIFNKFSN